MARASHRPDNDPIDPARIEPARTGPARTDPARVDPARVDPARTDPARVDTDAYLEWIGYGGTPQVDLATLTDLQQLHMTAVPFENLDIALGGGVVLDVGVAIDKIVEQGRGGWCFEVNGAFGALLTALGFDVLLLGAAVLLNGPTKVIDHVALEVMLDKPYLVDVGFGESFTRPLALNTSGAQPGGDGDYEFIASPQGTTLAKIDSGVPVAHYRFKRVAHRLDEFESAANDLQSDPLSKWRSKPFATRLLDRGPDRVTLTSDKLKVTRDGTTTERDVSSVEWLTVLHQWFGIRLDHTAPSRSGLAEQTLAADQARLGYVAVNAERRRF